MNYRETIEYLYTQLPVFQRQGPSAYKADLNNTIELCQALGNPQNQIKAIHIAGSNGKGSVSHMLSSILQEAGYKTGLYTSPHYKDFRERIRINGKMISQKYVVEFVAGIKNKISNIEPSFFELSVAMAFDYFRSQRVDIALIETGMGGRLDSTNVITPELSIITNISLDHTEFLGKTTEAIAMEKAGIIKEGVPVLIGKYQSSSTNIFKKKAKQCKSAIFFAAYSVKIKKLKSGDPGKLLLKVSSKSGINIGKLNLPLAGDYQIENLKTVIRAVEILRSLHFDVSAVALKSGLEKVRESTGMPGRFEILSRSPLTIVDGAHNVEGLKQVLKQVLAIKHRELHIVLGFVKDKDPAAMLELLPKKAIYYFCAANIPRALPADRLQSMAEQLGLQGRSYTSVKNALAAARGQTSKSDLILVGGSIFVAAEVL